MKWQNRPDFEDIYHEAQAKTFTEICNKIHKYYPEHKVMAWVNQILEWRFHDVLRQIRNRPRTFSLDELNSINNDADSHASKESSRVHKEIHEKDLSKTHQKTEDELLREFLKDDPEGILQNTCVGSDKNANLQKVLLMRFHEEKWLEISQKLGHSIPRLARPFSHSLVMLKIVTVFYPETNKSFFMKMGKVKRISKARNCSRQVILTIASSMWSRKLMFLFPKKLILVIFCVIFVSFQVTPEALAEPPSIDGCQVFPANNPWNRDISKDSIDIKLKQIYRQHW
ncbi:hypothetical protein NUACC26_024120 [Scytonema sp. NUACC26]